MFDRHGVGEMKRKVKQSGSVIERLEPRRLLASIFLDSAGVVHGVGTSGNDSLTVVGSNLDEQVVVTVNATSKSFDSDDVTGVSLEGLGGHDTFRDVSERDVTLYGGDGDDQFQGTTSSSKQPLFYGGAGRDLYVLPGGSWFLDLNDHPGVEDASAEFATLIGTDGDNRLTGGSASELKGGGGNDTLMVHDGGVMYGGDGNDRLISAETSSNGTHQLGGAGNDTLEGAEGVDYLDGGPGNDVLRAGGSSGNTGEERVEDLIGGDGNDTVDGGAGPDLLKGGAGLDTLDYSQRTVNLSITLGTTANDGAAGEGDNAWYDIETVNGGAGNDFISATGLNNVLRGNGGNDLLRSFGGNDALFGGSGHDRLEAGTGDDYLEGNSGNDALLGESGTDHYLGHDGDDWIFARDGVSETLNGGNGFDRAQRDPG